MSVRPLAKSLTVSQGKGINNVAARVSALMESIELHHAENYVPDGITCSIGDASISSDSVNPISLPLRSDAEYHTDRKVQWIAAQGLSRSDQAFIPREIVDRDSRTTCVKDRIFFSSSNGLASGNTLDEALIHAACEVVERDAKCFWFILCIYSRERRGVLNLDTVTDSHCVDLLEKIKSAGLKILVHYLESDVGIPVFYCTIWDDRDTAFYPQRASGSGCHLYKHKALSRAITEAAQSRLTHISGARDDMYWRKFMEHLPVSSKRNRSLIDWEANVESQKKFHEIKEAPIFNLASSALMWIATQIESVTARGAWFVDLSDVDRKIFVAQVICPLMEISSDRALYMPGERAVRLVENLR